MAWSSAQYLKFEDERTRPARDLLAQVPLETVERAYDLGCGPGNSTELLVARFGPDSVTGLDSDPNMLAAARSRLKGTRFVEADLETWQPPQPADLLYANAVFQWVPDHLTALARLMDGLRPGGVLAVQMPDNLQEPSHVAMEEAVEDGPWRARFKTKNPKRDPLPAPSAYFDRLAPKSSRLDVWQTVYNHPMAKADAVVEWMKGTGLRPYLDTAGLQHAPAFLEAYGARIRSLYRPMGDGRVLFRFPRLFVVAVRR
ncbi:trans-aconitate 2-methyltransferase [Dongia sp.]|uniref:trans-aconitate 2-methyltransferase n=1 Tax=Dongia sp. TaxID=1977262 RepID=UPI00375065F1